MAAAQWEKVDVAEFMRDVERERTEAYKMTPHHYVKHARIPWVVCARCGLVGLRNPLTAWCERVGCLARKHPDYARRCRL